MKSFLKDIEENFVSVVFVRPRKRDDVLLVPAKFTAIAKELTVETVLSKILTVYSKMYSFNA